MIKTGNDSDEMRFVVGLLTGKTGNRPTPSPKPTASPRRSTNTAAVERRRVARRLRSSWLQRRAERDLERATSRIRRHPDGQAVDLLSLDIRYWQAKQCGWDITAERLRTVGHRPDGSAILCDPTDTPHWRWWCRLHPAERQLVLRMSDDRPARAVRLGKAEAVAAD
jgi:hypothetical protein